MVYHAILGLGDSSQQDAFGVYDPTMPSLPFLSGHSCNDSNRTLYMNSADDQGRLKHSFSVESLEYQSAFEINHCMQFAFEINAQAGERKALLEIVYRQDRRC